MYHPKVIEARKEKFEQSLGYELIEYSTAYCAEFGAFLETLREEDESLKRPLTKEERAFINNELALSKINYIYWAERYSTINAKGSGLKSLCAAPRSLTQ